MATSQYPDEHEHELEPDYEEEEEDPLLKEPGAVIMWYGQFQGQRLDELPAWYQWSLVRWARVEPNRNSEEFARLYQLYTDYLDQRQDPMSTKVWFGKYQGREFWEMYFDGWYWNTLTNDPDSKWLVELRAIEKRGLAWRERQQLKQQQEIQQLLEEKKLKKRKEDPLPPVDQKLKRKEGDPPTPVEQKLKQWEEDPLPPAVQKRQRKPRVIQNPVGQRLGRKDDGFATDNDEDYDSDGGFVVPDDEEVEEEEVDTEGSAWEGDGEQEMFEEDLPVDMHLREYLDEVGNTLLPGDMSPLEENPDGDDDTEGLDHDDDSDGSLPSVSKIFKSAQLNTPAKTPAPTPKSKSQSKSKLDLNLSPDSAAYLQTPVSRLGTKIKRGLDLNSSDEDEDATPSPSKRARATMDKNTAADTPTTPTHSALKTKTKANAKSSSSSKPVIPLSEHQLSNRSTSSATNQANRAQSKPTSARVVSSTDSDTGSDADSDPDWEPPSPTPRQHTTRSTNNDKVQVPIDSDDEPLVPKLRASINMDG